ncbi:nucleotidyltransferase domain-containing protein [Paenibacillus lemnae]|uniref:Nucleotidyltransferase domain-containing protein n=1 Tax=Paenibacillus lemnae TaxID=1330551 RepID=A0A848M8D1_PAELE|nr:nucleotidyltransferase domain-containing protein [Paenibacillus lemnae]NMO96529.1 nucleotidyltransferase domain-containing protein [Paenibacillus lemnae]
MRNEPKAVAERLVLSQYPNCLLAVLGGSAGRGEHNEYSDLDIVIVDDLVTESYARKTIAVEDWIVELFFLNSAGYEDMFDAGVQSGNPTLQRILTEGIIIASTPEGLKVREAAQSDLEYGPMPFSSYDLDVSRYAITEYMMDLRSLTRPVEIWFTAQKLTILLCEFHLRVRQHWIGEGKTLFRLLERHDPETAERMDQALTFLYVDNDKEPILQLSEHILAPYGGPFLKGFEDQGF